MTRRQIEVLQILADAEGDQAIVGKRYGRYFLGGDVDSVEVSVHTVWALRNAGLIVGVSEFPSVERYAITEAGRTFLEGA
jgi:hypothetical protein